ncbi:hybrid sensor histidine kinase/response regulator [Aspergillus foveolatus]|uniref:hybrid sensor histidine kinase/response regulator n=1 Tax=Aspergillus foveolatus TaxID=210207 RepID=UPI003CCCCD09
MQEYFSPALRQPPLPDSEKKRLRELSRYYCAIRPSSVPPDPDVTLTQSEPENEPGLNVAQLPFDITLTALTQLGVHRLGCERSFASLIDGHSQHIISEATASISLRDREKHAPNDGLYLGNTTLDLVWGVCPHAIKLFSGYDVPHLKNTANVTANPTRYIVCDFTQEDYFKDRPYVTGWPHMRFYAEVPIYSPSGHILGGYCVVDNKPRQDFSEDEVIALQEISDAIARHLENVRTVHYHRRSDRLIRGLTTFVKDRLHERSPLDAPAPPRAAETPSLERLGLNELPSSTEAAGGTSPLISTQNAARKSTHATSLSGTLHKAVSSPVLNKVVTDTGSSQETVFLRANDNSSAKSTPKLAAKDKVPFLRRIENVYAYASSLLRESMDLDGVMFVDASRCNSGSVSLKADMLNWEPLPKNADPRPRSQYSNGAVADETICETLGLASNETDNQHGISDSLLRELIAAFPQGGVLLPDADNDNSQLLETRLAKLFPEAKSLLFIPLWDWNKGQWLAGTFVWTKDSEQERALGFDELHYFKVFGDSIISEIARLDWSLKEKSKFGLISSVSHEIRSPLHGMLANAELLSSSPLQPEQQQTVKALEMCGITLLDTLNHLLDFAKINNLVSINQTASSVTSLLTTFDLDVLIEEVVNSVFSGMCHAAIALTPPESPSNPDTAYRQGVTVVLRFENQDRWKVTSMTGAWRRIVMNILGNALKYTDSGFVEISVSLLDPPVETDPDSAIAHLRFTDTGCGMSQEFLKNKLFSPFAQEDALAEGAGLGLSIVKQLVSFFKGSIDVKSEIGVGTQVDIYIPVQLAHDDIATGAFGLESDMGSRETTFSLIGLDAYPELSEEPTGTLSSEAKRRICLQSFFTNLLSGKPNWKISSAATLAKADGEIAIISEAALKQLYVDESLRCRVEKNQTKFVCLCDGLPALSANGPGGAQVIRLYQPYSPRKVLQAIESVMQAKPQPFSAADDQLPPVSKATPPTNPTNDSAPPASGALGNKVLIVDDNEINLKVFARLMSKLGHQHTTATNGLIAFSKYKESPNSFSMVLMDISMPVMDGIDATRNIRAYEREKRLTPVKVFAVTGIGSAAMQHEALMAGVDDYLVKPLSLGQLGKLMKVHL